MDDEAMSEATLRAIRARLDEPPPLLALAERRGGTTALAEYLARLQQDRIALVDELDRLRAELGTPTAPPSPPAAQRHASSLPDAGHPDDEAPPGA